MGASRLFWLLGGGLWLLLLAGGWYVLLRHEFTPGPDDRGSEHWPSRTELTRDPVRRTLVLFALRSCPCTRATLNELAEIQARAVEQVSVQIVLVSPEEASGDRVGAGIEALARSLPGVQVRIDAEGTEARRFGARTSGQVFLYDRDGQLLFSGGITDSRGHAGESNGRRIVEACLQEGARERKKAFVYGCPLFADEVEE